MWNPALPVTSPGARQSPTWSRILTQYVIEGLVWGRACLHKVLADGHMSEKSEGLLEEGPASWVGPVGVSMWPGQGHSSGGGWGGEGPGSCHMMEWGPTRSLKVIVQSLQGWFRGG